jgi:hypothetical protein
MDQAWAAASPAAMGITVHRDESGSAATPWDGHFAL